MVSLLASLLIIVAASLVGYVVVPAYMLRTGIGSWHSQRVLYKLMRTVLTEINHPINAFNLNENIVILAETFNVTNERTTAILLDIHERYNIKLVGVSNLKFHPSWLDTIAARRLSWRF